MKKLTALILSILMVLSVCGTAFASPLMSEADVALADDPVILIAGDGRKIYYDNETKSFDTNDGLTSIFVSDEDEEDGNRNEAVANILMPFIREGILRNKWDNYYAAVQKEIGDLFSGVMLDENGNVSNDSGIHHSFIEENAYKMSHDMATEDGKYGIYSYRFWYDWRLDPLENADALNEYIEAVKAVTGKDKVSIITRCMGASQMLAYISKYGTGSIKGIGMDASTSLASYHSDAISGKFALDGNAIARFVEDYSFLGGLDAETANLIASVLDLLENSGMMDGITKAGRILIYNKIEYGIISAIALGTVFTFPGYWSMVSADDFEAAKTYVFGEEGSEKREKYAGMIAKLDNYNDNVKVKQKELLAGAQADGVNIGVISKYGFQYTPILRDADVPADQQATVANSSFGATTSKIYNTLDSDYIDARNAAGLGKYVSPDRQIDASTALFRDQTWFVKGASHNNWLNEENDILLRVVDAGRQLTVEDLPYARFSVHLDNGTDDPVFEPMTADNCHTEKWAKTSNPSASTVFEKMKLCFESLGAFFRNLFAFIRVKLFKR